MPRLQQLPSLPRPTAALASRPRRAWRQALLCALAALLLAAPAWAQLMVHPTRIVLGPGERAGQLEIINGGNEPTTYRISLVNRRMGEHGEFSEITSPQPDERFADAMLRYSPRRVTLAPGASQVIRLMARRPEGLEPGEYRSHLLFSPQPVPEGPHARNDAGGEQGIGIALTALVGVSIPVIVREGETSAEMRLDELALSTPPDSPPLLSLAMLRSGNQSVYGDLVVTFTPAGGTPVEVGRAGGVAVYTPNAIRRIRLALSPPQGTPLTGGALTVRYRERAEHGGAVLAESTLPLP